MFNNYLNIRTTYKRKRNNCLIVRELFQDTYYVQEEDAYIAKKLLNITEPLAHRHHVPKELDTLDLTEPQMEQLFELCKEHRIDFFLVDRFHRVSKDLRLVFRERNSYRKHAFPYRMKG